MSEDLLLETQNSKGSTHAHILNYIYRSFKTGFHMIADRRSQKVLRSSAIIWKHTSAIACGPAIVIADGCRR